MKYPWRLTVRDGFSAAHALREYQGKCENTHGHNFSVEINVEGAVLDERTGMLIDFKILKDLLKTVLARLDHVMLNGIEPFAQQNPSSENIARYIYSELASLLADVPQGAGTRLASVTVAEKETQSATYMGEPD